MAYMDKKKSMKPKKRVEKTFPDSLITWGNVIMNTPRAKHWTEGFNLKCSCGLEIPLNKYSHTVQCGCDKQYLLSLEGIDNEEFKVYELIETTAKLVEKLK